MSHVCKSDSVRYVVCWYTYKPADNTVQSPEHNPEHLATFYRHQLKKTDAVQERRGRLHANRARKVLEVLTLIDTSDAKDKLSNNRQCLGKKQYSTLKIAEGK